MMNTLSSRATFYDVIGYLVPGLIAICVAWLWCFVFVDAIWSIRLAKLMTTHALVSTFIMLAGGYVTGHLVNSVSSLLLEKRLFKDRFERAKDWISRVKENNQKRYEVIKNNVSDEFHIPPESLGMFDMRIRMEECMPNATITGFSFLSFYGMSRTLALLSWLAVIPACVILGRHFSGDRAVYAILMTFVGFVAIGGFFCHQYLRFVEYYYDFLGSTLMHKTDNK